MRARSTAQTYHFKLCDKMQLHLCAHHTAHISINSFLFNLNLCTNAVNDKCIPLAICHLFNSSTNTHRIPTLYVHYSELQNQIGIIGTVYEF